MTGDVDLDRLDAALRETLTTAFPHMLAYFTEVGDALWVTSRPAPPRVLWRSESADGLLQLGQIDPAGQELYRFSCWQGSPESLLLRLDFSHLVFDGGCYAPFCAALSACWRGEEPVREPAVRKALRPDPAAAEAYWRAKLTGRRLHQPLSFRVPTPNQAGRLVTVRETLVGERAEEIHRFLRRHEISLLQFVVAVSGALVHAYGDGDEQRVMVAHTVDTREYGAPYGCHTNLLPLWLDVAADASALSLLDQVRREREELRDHQDFPTLDVLALAAGRAGDHGGSLLNLVVNASSAMLPSAVPELNGVDVSWVRKPDTGSSSDLTIHFGSDDAGLHFSFDSTTRLTSPEALSALATNFLRMVRFMATEPHRSPSYCDLSRPLAPVAEGARTPPGYRGLGDVLADAARRNADRGAVVDDHRSLSYGQLLGAANRLGQGLAESGDGPIGVFLERSAAIPVAYLAALALRRTFVPLDPAFPDYRLTQMATVAGLGVVLVDAATSDRAAHLFPWAPVHDVGPVVREATDPPGGPSRWGRPPDRNRIAYILFTSGSTGDPKGVAVTEGNLANFLLSVRDDPGMRPEDRILALTPVSFDISLLEILLPVLCGARLEVLDDETRLSGTLLAERIDRSGATVVQATPSTWRILRAVGWRAERPMTVLCGGETLGADLAAYLLGQGVGVYHMYGPTEATIWSSWQRVTDARHVHLGTPAHNTRHYVVDVEGRSVAPGMRGELVIVGDCVGQGYLNAPSTPFHMLPDGSPAYLTGDVVQYHGSSVVTYVGRKDGQCKVNGYRVELDEVAAAVRAVTPSATVHAVLRPEPEPHLRCFVWLPSEEDFDAESARAWCQDTLPYYMVPLGVHRLREIPLTPNGKTDVARLSQAPLSSLGLQAEPAEPPACGDEPARSALVWESVLAELRRLVADELHVRVRDVDEPLGYQGVNSLGYNALAARIRERYGVVVHVHEFYRLNTLRSISETVARLTGDRLQARSRPEEAAPPAPVAPRAGDRLAIVGLSAVLPGGRDPEAFWEALVSGTDSVGPAAPERGLPGELAGFLPRVTGFDARFFSISPLEANWMDPRQRLLLQSTWHVLEDAGYAPCELRGSRTGCYIAATGNDYALLQARAGTPQVPYSLVGHSLSLIANRISSWFDWHGPSATLDTACSGSLVALVRACRDLRAGVCDAAVAGGVNLILDQQINDGLHAARFLSPGHRCAAFDSGADGYVRGEGYGTVLVKRLDDALAAGDNVLAVVDSVAENHGGRANSLTAPNPQAQYRLLLDAYTPDLAALTSYIETHGTGTELGDAIEVDALKRAWEHLVPGLPRGPVWLGAVKSHIGHLEPAAGIASVAKVTKAFEHQALPANLHLHELNPAVEVADTPFEVLEKTVSWTAEPLVAGVSSFGFGGSNAHVVLSAPPRRPVRARPRAEAFLVPLSARSPAALRTLVTRLLDHLEHGGRLLDEHLLDLSYTLCRGREHFDYRQAWLVSSTRALADAWRTPAEPVHATPTDWANEPAGSGPATPELAREAFLAGRPVDWTALFAGHAPRRLRFPVYPFDETDYWFADGGRRT